MNVLLLIGVAAAFWYFSRSAPASSAAPIAYAPAVDVPGTTQQFSDPMQTVMPAAIVAAAVPEAAPAIAAAQIISAPGSSISPALAGTAPASSAAGVAPSYGVLDSDGGSQVNINSFGQPF
jgi:hypothetical protein